MLERSYKDMKLIQKIYKTYKEAIDYLFWGGIAFVLSMVLFWVFASLMGMNEVVANTIDWWLFNGK